MKIAINTRLLLPNRLDGIGWFTYEHLKRITQNHPAVSFTFIFDRRPDPQFMFAPNVKAVALGPQARHPFLYVWWFEWSVKRYLDKHPHDIFISPDGFIPLNTNTKTLSVIHDLGFEANPENLPLLTRWYFKYFFPRFAQKSNRIVTVSHYSKQDIIARYKVSEDKIDVVHNAAGEHFKPVEESQKIRFKNKHTHAQDYFLFVGNLHPRKNIARLFQAFQLFKKKSGSPIKLMVVGAKQYWTTEIENAFNALEYKEDLVFPGRLSSDELVKAYGSTKALVYVPYFEGFGIPIVEAMKCDCPVITSNLTSMPEVAGDAALLVDPFNVEQIADAMLQLTKDNTLIPIMINRGQKRSNQFSWDKAAAQLWEVITKTINS